MLAYPSALPVGCAKTLFEIIRGRQVGERKEEFAACLWNVQGYAQGLLLGPGPDHEAHLFGSGTKTTEARREAAKDDGELQEIGEALMQCQAELAANPPEFGASPTARAINWALLMQMIPTILQLLKELGIIKTEVSFPGFIGASAGDFPQSEQSSEEGETFGHDGKLSRKCSIDELDLTPHAKDALKSKRLKTVGDVLDYQAKTEGGLQSIAGIGEATEEKFNELTKDLRTA